MRHHVFAAIVCVAAAGISPLCDAYAAPAMNSSRCSSYVGSPISAQSFDVAIERLTNLSPKGEFETTAEYASRTEAANLAASEPLIIAKEPESVEYFRYDADTQKLQVQSYAFDNTNFQAWEAFYAAKEHRLTANTTDNLDVVISVATESTGTHVATNSFGVRVEVQELTQTTKAIFQRNGRYPDTLFRHRDKDGVIGELSIAPSDAKALKPQLKVAFVVRPKEPYLIRSTYPLGTPTVSNPRQITVHATVLIADFECGLLLDGTNKVIGAYDTVR
jgi:hypothetical protein